MKTIPHANAHQIRPCQSQNTWSNKFLVSFSRVASIAGKMSYFSADVPKHTITSERHTRGDDTPTTNLHISPHPLAIFEFVTETSHCYTPGRLD
jgi:hypothetical protein